MWLADKYPPQAHVFEHLNSNWWHCSGVIEPLQGESLLGKDYCIVPSLLLSLSCIPFPLFLPTPCFLTAMWAHFSYYAFPVMKDVVV